MSDPRAPEIVRFEQWWSDMGSIIAGWNKLVAERQDFLDSIEAKDKVILDLTAKVTELTAKVEEPVKPAPKEKVKSTQLYVDGKQNEDCPFDWVGHPHRDPRGDDECEARHLIDQREKINVLAWFNGGESYDYDESVLIELERDYYILRVSGSSCCDPYSDWYVASGPCDSPEDAFVAAGDPSSKHTDNWLEGLWRSYAGNKYRADYRPWDEEGEK